MPVTPLLSWKDRPPAPSKSKLWWCPRHPDFFPVLSYHNFKVEKFFLNRPRFSFDFNYIGFPLVFWAARREPTCPWCFACEQEPIWPYHSPGALLVKILIIKFLWPKKLWKMKPFWTEYLENCCINRNFQNFCDWARGADCAASQSAASISCRN